MARFEVYATGSYTFTQYIEAETAEEAAELFNPSEAEICHNCGNDGIHLDDVSGDVIAEEADPEDD